MTMHKALHPRDRLYISRKEGGRGLTSIEDSVDASIQRLEDYIEKHERGLITAIGNDTKNTIEWQQQNWEKKLYGRFKRLINNISHQKTWTWLRKGNLKREMESLLIAAQDNAIKTNHIKARIDKTQQNRKCRLCGDRDETINYIISECSKLAQKKYKARHDWVGKVIHLEMCKKFQFDHTNKWYMQNQAPILENDTHKLLWDFNTQTDHLIPARRPDLIISNKKKKKKRREFAKCSTLPSQRTTELKKLWNMKVTIVPIVIGAFGTVTKGLLKGLEDLAVGRRVETIQTTSIIENGQNTEKSPGDLRRLAVTQATVKHNQLMLMRKNQMSK